MMLAPSTLPLAFSPFTTPTFPPYVVPVKLSKDLLQCYAIQQVVFETIERLKNDPGLPLPDRITALATLVRTWDTTVERKRILRGKPHVKPVEAKPFNPKRKPRAVAAFVELSAEPGKESLLTAGTVPASPTGGGAGLP